MFPWMLKYNSNEKEKKEKKKEAGVEDTGLS